MSELGRRDRVWGWGWGWRKVLQCRGVGGLWRLWWCITVLLCDVSNWVASDPVADVTADAIRSPTRFSILLIFAMLVLIWMCSSLAMSLTRCGCQTCKYTRAKDRTIEIHRVAGDSDWRFISEFKYGSDDRVTLRSSWL